MASKFDTATLATLRDVKEVGIRTGNNPERKIVIWVVVVGDEVFVRSVRGSKGRWYEAAATDGRAMLDIGGRLVPIRAIPVADCGVIDLVSQAYLTKYPTSPYAKDMVRAEVLPTTLRLAPI